MTMPDSERPLPPPPNLPGNSTPPASGTPPQALGGATAVPSTVATSSGLAPSPRPPGGRRSGPLTIPPPREEVADDEYGVRAENDFKPEQAIEDQISELEAWARAIVRLDRRELARFWFLRGLGFLSAAGAVTGGALRLPDLAILAGAVAAAAIAIDAAWPAATDRGSRRRAIRDLRELQHTLKLKWNKVRLAYPAAQSARRIAHALTLLDMAQAKREEIGKFLGDAAPGVQHGIGSELPDA